MQIAYMGQHMPLPQHIDQTLVDPQRLKQIFECLGKLVATEARIPQTTQCPSSSQLASSPLMNLQRSLSAHQRHIRLAQMRLGLTNIN